MLIKKMNHLITATFHIMCHYSIILNENLIKADLLTPSLDLK